jgi:hypothetical protein
MALTGKRTGSVLVNQHCKQSRNKNITESVDDRNLPDNVVSGTFRWNNNEKDSEKENCLDKTNSCAHDDELDENNTKDLFVNINSSPLKREEEAENTYKQPKSTGVTLLKKRSKYPNLLPGEVGNLTRYVRKELFFRLKFVTNNMFIKFRIADLCFEQLNVTDSEEKRRKEQSIVKVVKDALNSRRGYASQLLSEKLKGKNEIAC